MGIFSKKKEVTVKEVSANDSITSLVNAMANSREASNVNRFKSNKIDRTELQAIFKSGIPRRIIQIKSGYALKGDMEFAGDDDRRYYNNKLLPIIKKVAQFQLGFGRGIVVVGNIGDDLALELPSTFEPRTAKMYCFSGDMVTVGHISRDLENERYNKPVSYNVRGHNIHWTRVVDFTYIDPVEIDAPEYMYGGIPEVELIYSQLINDGIIQRSNSTIIEKASTVFYKLVGFKDNLRTNQTGALLSYFKQLENLRGIYGAGIVDAEDGIETVSQQINGLKEMDDISLRRLSLVTGIPVSILVGESVKGLNSTGEDERLMFNETIEDYRESYLVGKINQLMTMLGRGEVSFKENSTYSPSEKIAYERSVLENAMLLQNMGEDSSKYLEEKGVVKSDPVGDFFAMDNLDA